MFLWLIKGKEILSLLIWTGFEILLRLPIIPNPVWAIDDVIGLFWFLSSIKKLILLLFIFIALLFMLFILGFKFILLFVLKYILLLFFLLKSVIYSVLLLILLILFKL